MTTSTHLGMTHVEVSQASKEVTVNQALNRLDAQAGEFAKALSDANYTLSSATEPPEWCYGTQVFTGALTAGRNIVVPVNKLRWLVYNNTTGGFALTVKTSAGTGIAIAAGKHAWVRGDGTNVVRATADSP